MADNITNLIPVSVMGKTYEVPLGLTIMKALEYAGYKLTRGCGCRGGVCGACATIYRKKGEYRLQGGAGLSDGGRAGYLRAAAAVFPGQQSAL